MSVVLGLLVGVLAVRLLVASGRELLVTPALERSNCNGRMVPTAMGMLAVVAVVLIEGGRSLFGAFGVGNASADAPRLLVLAALVGFGLLGLFDDFAGTQSDQGFRGHFGALARGRVTTGVVKVAGGCALAVVLVSVGVRGVSGLDVSGARVISDALL